MDPRWFISRARPPPERRTPALTRRPTCETTGWLARFAALRSREYNGTGQIDKWVSGGNRTPGFMLPALACDAPSKRLVRMDAYETRARLIRLQTERFHAIELGIQRP